MRSYGSAFPFLAALLVAGTMGCRTGGLPRPATGSPAAIEFENRTEDVVRVYLVKDSRQWPLGRVEPGRRARLAVATALLDGGESYGIAVLPVGTPNPGAVPGALAREPLTFTPAAIRTLVQLGWTLQGSVLTSYMR